MWRVEVKRPSRKIVASIIAVTFVLLVAASLILIQRFNDYKLKTNLTVFQEREMRSTVDNFIVMLDAMRNDTIENYKKSGLDYTEEDVKTAVLDFARQVVHNSNFANGAYIWINEVVRYSGGDNYAIRQVHGNLKDTEGMYLSTSMQDAQGALPYLEELNGIKEKGEITYKYYFKEYQSDVESEKITYAKLYEPYNWIVCTGTYLNSMYEPAGGVSHKTNMTFYIFCSVLIFLAIVIFVFVIVTSLISSRKLLKETELLKGEVATDSLTGAGSRSYGEQLLIESLNLHKTSGQSISIAILDIDSFKSINDRYGHYVGDDILKNLVDSVKTELNPNDSLIRWGGDEFILIFNNDDEDQNFILDKLNKKIAGQIVTTEIGAKINYTISIGACHINYKDENYVDVVKRADDALYLAKRTKNTYYIIG